MLSYDIFPKDKQGSHDCSGHENDKEIIFWLGFVDVYGLSLPVLHETDQLNSRIF